MIKVNPPGALAASAAVLAGVLAAGCAAKESAAPIYYEVRLEANAPNVAECNEAVALRFEPVKVDPQPADSLYQTETYTDQPTIVGKAVADGPDKWECRFTYRSRDLAPGQWRIVGEFSDGPRSCIREVRSGGQNRVRIDQNDGCVEFGATDQAG